MTAGIPFSLTMTIGIQVYPHQKRLWRSITRNTRAARSLILVKTGAQKRKPKHQREGERERCGRCLALLSKTATAWGLPPDCLFSSHPSPPPFPPSTHPPPSSSPIAPSLSLSVVSAASSLQQPGGCWCLCVTKTVTPPPKKKNPHTCSHVMTQIFSSFFQFQNLISNCPPFQSGWCTAIYQYSEMQINLFHK